MNRKDFLSSFERLQSSFKKALEDTEYLDKQYTKDYDKFRTSVRVLVENSKKSLSITDTDNNPLKGNFSKFIQELEGINSKFNQNRSNRDKGIRFREKYEDSLLVFIYGKVKSGKSSLGNYMVWGKTSPQEEYKKENPNADAEFFCEEDSGVSTGDKKNYTTEHKAFRVDICEATNTIQGFTLPGLTWVDSPGLHSQNKENGEKSREYVAHADLIIYTMSSNAVGRVSDIKEISELVKNNKKIVILITRSDVFEEEGYVDGHIIRKLCMKSKDTRKEHIELVKGEGGQKLGNSDLEKVQGLIKKGDIKIISISALYAEEANDNDALQDSGIPELFNILHAISEGEGVKIKRNTPMTNFLNFIQKCKEDIEEYAKNVKELSESTDKLKEKIGRRIEIAKDSIGHKIKIEINDSYHKMEAFRNNQSKINKEIETRQKQWKEKANNLLTKEIDGIFQEITSGFRDNLTTALENSRLNLSDYSLEKTTKTVQKVRNSGGRAKNAATGAVVGATIGLLFGPVGSAIGGALGGAIGGMSGSDASIETKDIEITVGDNLQKLCNETVEQYKTGIQNALDKNATQISKEFFESVGSFIQEMNNELSQIKSATDNLVATIKTKLQ